MGLTPEFNAGRELPPRPERKPKRSECLRGGELMRRAHAQHARAARKQTSAHHPRSARALPACVRREASYPKIRGKAQLFRGLKQETPRLRLRGVDPSRQFTFRRDFETWLCGPATPRYGSQPGETPPAADPGVWLGRKMASLYGRLPGLSSSSVK